MGVIDIILTITVIIIIIMLILHFLFNVRPKKINGGGADDISKHLVGRIFGCINNLRYTFLNNTTVAKLETHYGGNQYKSPDYYTSCYIFYSKIALLSLTSKQTLILNAEFNENYTDKHRIKNVFTTLLLGLKIIREIYNDTDDEIIISYEERFGYILYFGNGLNELRFSNDRTLPLNMDILNINYKDAGEFAKFINYKNQFEDVIYSFILNQIRSESPLMDYYSKNFNDISGKYNPETSHGEYGHLMTESKNIPSDKLYGFAYKRFTFNDNFDTNVDFNKFINTICEVNGINTDFIGKILMYISKNKKIPDQIVFKYFDNNNNKIKSHTHTLKSYVYYKKLASILAMCTQGITYNFGTKNNPDFKTSTLSITELLKIYDINPDLLIYK